MAFVEHKKPCSECGGSDPVSINEDGSAWCFSCKTYFKSYYGGKSIEQPADFKSYRNNSMNDVAGEFLALSDRGISLATARKYGVKSITNNNGEIVKHFYPYYNLNEIAGYKVREQGKIFSWKGDSKSPALFGQQLFQHGKYITLVEGECDAMAAYEMLGSKWPVVSIKNGAAGATKDIKANLEYLEKFDNIVIAFDNDRPGRDAAIEVAKLLTPGKAKLFNFGEEFKDANDMLRQHKHEAFITAWWAAPTYTPAGVINVTNNINELLVRKKKEAILYPWAGLNRKLLGLRQGELVVLAGGTGLGKSSITRELEHWIMMNTKDCVGIIALEETWERTADGILSIETNKRLHIDEVREEFGSFNYQMAANKIFGGDNAERVWIHSHFGGGDVDDVMSKIRYMIKGCGCKWIILDHLHMLVSGSGDQERAAIESAVNKLIKIVSETGVGLILVSHLKRPEGNKGHEEGAVVSLSQLRGSHAISQGADCVIALERNQQSDDPIEANTTHVRVLKARYTGDVGMAAHLLYNKETGRLVELEEAEVEF